MHVAYYSEREVEWGGSLYHAITLCSDTWLNIEKSKRQGLNDLNYQPTKLCNNKKVVIFDGCSESIA